MGTEAEGKREVEVVVGLVEAVEVVVEDTKTKEKMRTKNNWTGERKTILAKDDEETLPALKSRDKQSLRSVCSVCTLL